jgi:lipoprotein-anchoring transpeptidase ErfK/SrfK
MTTIRILRTVASLAALVAATTLATKASANGFFLFDLFQPPQPQVESTVPGPDYNIDARLRRQIVEYRTTEAPGTIIIDTPNTYLYLVLGNGRALRY